MKKVIMVVDDAMTNLATAKKALQNNYTVFTAPSAEVMFGILEKRLPQLILLDIEMPVTNGYEALTALKNDPRYKAIPVVFLTAHDDDDTRVKCMNLGSADFISKPFDEQGLLETVKTFAVL